MKEEQYIIGDATRPKGSGNKIIAHVCNDIGGWGRGFVLAVSRRWKKPEEEYRRWHAQRNDFALGEVQLVEVESGLWVANMVGQHDIHTRGGVPPVRYEALEQCLTKLALLAREHHASVHMPRIACGLAGGTWEKVQPIVRRTLGAHDVDTFVYSLPTKQAKERRS